MRGRASGLPSTTLLSSARLPVLCATTSPSTSTCLAGDPVVDELADHRVGADDDEDGRGLTVPRELGFPSGRRPFHRSGAGCAGHPRAPGGGSQSLTLSLAARLGSCVADEVPQPQVGHQLVVGVVIDRGAGHLDDAGLDGVHQREVADGPREDVALVVARALTDRTVSPRDPRSA